MGYASEEAVIRAIKRAQNHKAARFSKPVSNGISKLETASTWGQLPVNGTERKTGISAEKNPNAKGAHLIY